MSYEPLEPGKVINHIFNGSNILVKVDGKSAEILKIFKDNSLLINEYMSRSKYKVTSKTERITYEINEFDMSSVAIDIIHSDEQFVKTLIRLLTDDDHIILSRLCSLYKTQGSDKIIIEREDYETSFLFELNLKSSELYSKEAITLSELKLFELIEGKDIILKCRFLNIPETSGVDLKPHKYKIESIKERVQNYIYDEDEATDYWINY